MKNFDTFIGIDWSGALKPVHTRSICVAACERGAGALVLVASPAHKHWSRENVYHYIQSLLKSSQRILIGIDANFGYAQEIGAMQFGKNYDYRDLWRAVDEASENADNFFAGGFWEHPDYARYFWTQGRQPPDINLAKRSIEKICGEKGCGWPESPFKLIGPKQVGKGGLAAMRMAHALRQTHGDKIAFWPYEMDKVDKAQIVVTEIYPRQFLKRAGHGNSKIKTLNDLNQALPYFGSDLCSGVKQVSDHETDALISAAGLRWLCGDANNVPRSLSHPTEMDDAIAKREGWIFGV